MIKIALIVEYDGSSYHGWQSQPNINLPTIQQQLAKAVSYVANETVNIFCAGRTDAKVHATYQVVHFTTNAVRANYNWLAGINQLLPEDIRVAHVQEVSLDFDARYSAIARTYNYFIYNSKIKPSLFRNYLAWYYQELNIPKMQQASQYLVGEHDFASFRGKDCQSKTSVRTIHNISCEIYNQAINANNTDAKIIKISITANAFLKHMVRNMVGVLIKIGSKYDYQPSWAQQVLLAKDRTAADATAKPEGLYLTKVDYPEQFNLPKLNNRINFFI
jgi:tRNA pseudouridine38-40 synthase